MSSQEFALLRTLKTRKGQHEDQHGVFLDDPLGLCRERTFLGDEHWRVARLLNGQRSPAEVAELLAQESQPANGNSTAANFTPSATDVEQIIRGLSERLLLDDEQFASAAQEALGQIPAGSLRPHRGAGRDYPAEPLDLRIHIGGLVANDWDMPPVPHGQGLLAPAGSLSRMALLYAKAYASVRHIDNLARIVILADAQAPLGRLLVPMERDVDTPLGKLSLDSLCQKSLSNLSGPERLAHEQSDVIERQALFLRLLFRNVPVFPILVSAPAPLWKLPEGGPNIWDTDSFETSLESALASLQRLQALEGRTLFIAATDLEPPHHDPESKEPHRDRDRHLVDLATRMEARELSEVICGHFDGRLCPQAVPLYLLMRLLEDQAHTPGAPVDPSDPDRKDLESGKYEAIRGSTLGYKGDEWGGAAAVLFH